MDADAGVQDAQKGNTRKDKECLISYEAYSVFYYYHFLYTNHRVRPPRSIFAT